MVLNQGGMEVNAVKRSVAYPIVCAVAAQLGLVVAINGATSLAYGQTPQTILTPAEQMHFGMVGGGEMGAGIPCTLWLRDYWGSVRGICKACQASRPTPVDGESAARIASRIRIACPE